MSYAVISVGGKQYRVSEGQRLLVDRLAVEDGKTFTPEVLLVGGDGDPQLAPTGVVVTAKVVGSLRGPKIRIGKYKKRTGYKRHTGFRAALTQIEIESIGGARAKAAAKPKAPAKETAEQQAAPEKAEKAAPTQEPVASSGGLPAGYADMTIAVIKDAVASWDTPTVTAALEYERAHGNRKGAIAALESALAEEGH